MSHTMSPHASFESAVAEAQDWLNRITLEIDGDDPHLALQALRGGLHALRDHLTVEQNAHLAAQLPTLVRGLYFEGWKPDAPVASRDREAFLARVNVELRGYRERCSPEEAARAVFAVLEESVSGSAEKIRTTLPKAIRDLWY